VLPMSAITDQGMDAHIGDLIVGTCAIGTCKSLGRNAFGRAAPAFDCRPRSHCGMSHHGIDRGGVLAAGAAVIWGTGLQEALQLCSGRAGPADERLDALMQIDVLILDDLGAEYLTAWAAEQLFVLLKPRPTYYAVGCR